LYDNTCNLSLLAALVVDFDFVTVELDEAVVVVVVLVVAVVAVVSDALNTVSSL